MANRRGKSETVKYFIFLGSKITEDADNSHEIKIRLLLGRKAKKNLDIAWLTKVLLVKAMLFPMGMYQCKSWTIKKGWTTNNWWFWIVMLEKTLESPLDYKEIKWVSPKGNTPWLMLRLKLQYFGQLMWRTDSLEKTLMLGKIEGRRRRGCQKLTWLDGITDSMDMNVSQLWEVVKDREAWRAAVHEVTRSQNKTERLINSNSSRAVSSLHVLLVSFLFL